MTYILPLNDPQATLDVVGGKGASLARLANAGLPVPGGFHITTAAYRQFVLANSLQPQIMAAVEAARADSPATLEAAAQAIGQLFERAAMPGDIAQAITQAYTALDTTAGAQGAVVAVRSSATAEDLPGLSFAGQQETFLNIRGTQAVLGAVKKCWASLWTARAIGYRQQHQIDQAGVSLAVVVQALVFADAAGVLFTAHPVTGRRDQAMLTATWGLGEAIVGGLVTPDTLTVDKASGRVLSRETAEKRQMTVRLAESSGTEEQAVPEARRRAPVLNDRQARELTRMGVQIEQHYGMPMDIEWALAGGEFAIVQARPITALPEAPAEWKLPKPGGRYMRGSIVDFMADPLSPLFATMGLPSVVAGIRDTMREMTQSEPALPADYFVTINSYAYLGYGYNAREWLYILSMMLSLPRFIRLGLNRWRKDVLPRYRETVSRWQARPLAELSAAELWQGASEIVTEAGDYVAALMVGTLGASGGTEGLFTAVYDKLVKKAGDPAAPAYLMGYDSLPIQAEKSLYDLAQWVRPRPALADFILQAPPTQWGGPAQPPAGVSAEDWRAWCERWAAHLNCYGHIIYNLDFARPLPVDDPAPVLEVCRMFLRGQGANPYERQQNLEARREQATRAARQRLKGGLRRWAFDTALRWAQSLSQVRETAIADIGLGYPRLRVLLHELGTRLAAAGVLVQAADIYWLGKVDLDRAVAALQAGTTPSSLAPVVRANQAAHEAALRLTPPTTLPRTTRFLGIDLSAFVPDDRQTGDTIKGAATSAGKVTAPARVLRGPEDFDQMRPGDVLVAATTTPAWTPLFAMASAVVTDVGGPLSHGSIVAREYNIPAVMGTGVATRRIHSGQMITVDGTAGTVSLAKVE